MTTERTVAIMKLNQEKTACSQRQEEETMEKNNTKETILEESLDLFSVNGYEATSISQIADAVGIRKASLYSHFANKQDILDHVIEMVLDGYYRHTVFAHANWEDPEFTKDKDSMTSGDVAKMILGQIRYILHDPHISKGRKMLLIEQFRNEEMARLQTKMNYADVLDFFTGMMRFLIRKGTLKDADSTIMATQFTSPITVWINLCDREPEREEEAMGLVEKHIMQFFEIYRN